MRITRVVFKIGFIIVAVVLPFFSVLDLYKSANKAPAKQLVKNGVYEVTTFAINKRSVPFSLSDSLRWQDVIFEDGTGSIKTADTAFRQRYRRGYFAYTTDNTHIIHFKKHQTDSLAFLNFHYEMPDGITLRLWGKQHGDSLYVELKRINRHFQLAERQFHWLSESNR
jgi:hypothetical protein